MCCLKSLEIFRFLFCNFGFSLSSQKMNCILVLLLLSFLPVILGLTKYNFTEEELYESCEKQTGIICFGFKKSNEPTDCVKHKDCHTVVKIFSDDKDNRYFRIRFQLMGRPWKSGPFVELTYIAVGISYDNLMGEDSVIECRSYENRVISSWNAAKGNNREFQPGSEPVHYYHTNWISSKDGVIYCDFYRDIVSIVETNIIDLSHNSEAEYFILLAYGLVEENKASGERTLLRHSGARSSKTPILNPRAITIPRTLRPQSNQSRRNQFTLIIFLLFMPTLLLNCEIYL